MDVCLNAHNQGATHIELRMSSIGGSTTVGFQLYNFLKSLPITISTHNSGAVNSMAIPLYLVGEKRTADPDTKFLIHPFTWDHSTSVLPYRAHLNAVDQLNADIDAYENIIKREAAGICEVIDIRDCLISTERLILAREAKSLGMVNMILRGTIPPGATTWWINS